MIDTVVLLLSQDMYQISDPDKFVPTARWMLESRGRTIHGIQSKQNPTRKELLAGIYKPALRLFYNISEKDIALKVELSLPKLMYGNNFEELKGKDLQPLLQKLSFVLSQMGVIVSAEALAQAPVSAIHYSKNIPLTDGSTPYHYINKINEANINLHLDVNQTHYRNEGHSYKWHANSYEVVFYDKIKDLEKAKLSDKRALEKDNALQLNLFDTFAKRRKKFEILRMEVRLNKRQKIKHLFTTLGIKTDLTLASLFKQSISKKVLLHYLDELERKRLPLIDFKSTNDKALLTTLIVSNPDLTAKRILQMFGLAKALATMNMRELRAMFASNWRAERKVKRKAKTPPKSRAWARLMSEAQEIKLPGKIKSLDALREHIIKFKALKLSKA